MASSARNQLRRLKDEYARNPESRVFVHLAEAHRRAGELRQAQQVLTDGMRHHPDDPSARVVLARVLADEGDAERSAEVWRDVVRLDPDNLVALRALAELMEAAGRREEAMELFRRVVRLENGEPDTEDPLLALASGEDDDAPPPSAPEPASRFSWLVRSIARPFVEPPAALAPGAPARDDAPRAEAQPAPLPARRRLPRGVDADLFAEFEGRAADSGPSGGVLDLPARVRLLAGGQEDAEDEPATDEPESPGAPVPDELDEIETQEEIVAAVAADEGFDAAPLDLAELARLAYDGTSPATPAGRMEDEEVGPAAALVEVLVRLLERNGRSARAESSVRRLVVLGLAREMGLAEAEQDALALAALLGGLGELAGPVEPGPEGMRLRHATTLQLLAGVALPDTAREALAHQFERWDGGGIPAGLREDEIPFPARVLAVARAAAPLLAGGATPPPVVADALLRDAGSAFDPLVAGMLRRVVARRERHGIGHGRVAVVHGRELRAMELTALLQGHGYAAETTAASGLREVARSGSPHAVVIGAELPDAAARVRELRAQAPGVVVAVDAADPARRVELLAAGADACFPPDAELAEVRATVEALLGRAERAGTEVAAVA